MALPLAVGVGVASQVDCDVPDPAAHATHQLRLARAGLEVESAEDVLARAGVVLLDRLHLDAQLAPESVAEGLDQEASFVAVDLRLDEHESVELCLQVPRH